MAAVIEVFLITGFLGSGKTTFLNRLIAAFPQDRKLMILMNEFGDIGVDGLLVAGEDLDILEISRGSIFCACVKTDFIRGLASIAREIRPDLLVIEATGAADPGDMKRDLGLPVFQNRFRLREQICLIDAANFTAVYEAFASVEKQMAAATCFIINKTDLAEPDEIRRIRGIVGRHHPSPVFFEAAFGAIPLERFTAPGGRRECTGPSAPVPPDEMDVEAAIDALLKDPFRAMLPPDPLASAVYRIDETTAAALHTFVNALPDGLIRAKGFVLLDGVPHLFNWVMGRTDLHRAARREIPAKALGRVVFIGPREVLKTLAAERRRHPMVRNG